MSMKLHNELFNINKKYEERQIVVTLKNFPEKKLYQLHSIFLSGKSIKGWVMTEISGISMFRGSLNTPISTTINITAIKI